MADMTLPELDLRTVVNWDRAEHFEALRAAVRLSANSTAGAVLRYVAITEGGGCLVWEFGGVAALMPAEIAKNLVVELTEQGFLFAIEEKAGRWIKRTLNEADEDRLTKFFTGQR